jgi:tetratricopeptide (TPR) repeat protein
MMVVYNFADVDEAMQKAKAYAKLAIEKNSRYVGGYISMAWIQHNHEWKWKESEENFRKAIKLNPNYATGNQWFSIHLSNTGKHAEGIKYAVKATELHPESMIIKLSAAQIHYFAGENETALHYCNEASKIDPYFSTTIFLKYAKIYDSYSEEDVTHIREAIRLYPDQPMNRKVLSEVLLKQGNREAALEQLILLLEGYHDTMNKAHFAETFFVMGMPEQGYRWLEKAIEAREGWAVFYGTFPSLKKYQQEPRFRELYKKIDHPLYVD